jgi:hypothetical protein
MGQWAIVGVAMCGLALATSAAAQTPFERVWIDVNAGVAMAAEGSFTMQGTLKRGAEDAVLEARYTLPRAGAVEAGAGIMFTPRFGIGASFERTADEHSAELSAHVPHPFFLNTIASDTAETGDVMRRSERSVSVQAVFLVAETHGIRLRAFGGPSWFRVLQGAVTEITYNQFYFVRQPTNVVELTGFKFGRVDGTGWGFNAGADASMFFTRMLGVGGYAKFSRGRVDVENTLATFLEQDEVTTTTAGGFRVGGGIRFKF